MARKKRSVEELRAASDDLKYEIEMFRSLARGLGSGIASQGWLPNALLECFTVHARILLDFLYSKKRPKEDDVIAEDFLQESVSWPEERPAKSETVESVHGRVGKEIAHLTFARQQVTSESKPWPFVDIANEVEAVLAKFLSVVPDQLLGKRWDEHKKARTADEDQ